MPQQPISSSVHRPFRTGKRQRHQVIYSLVLVLFIFAGLLANLATAIPAHAPNERYSQNSPAASAGDGWSLPLLVSGTSSVGWMALAIA